MSSLEIQLKYGSWFKMYNKLIYVHNVLNETMLAFEGVHGGEKNHGGQLRHVIMHLPHINKGSRALTSYLL